jgi:putative ABC transport system permease protein
VLSDLLFRLRAILRRGAVENELDEELRFHSDRQVERLVEAGCSRAEALRRVRLEHGGLGQVKEECRQARGTSSLEIYWRDLRYALRILSKNPGFTVVAALTLAIGIGANTAIFTLVNATLLRPLPYPGADRIVMLWGGQQTPFSSPTFLDYQRQNHVFEHMATAHGGSLTLTDSENSQTVRTGSVSTEFFQVLGVKPILGRDFLAEEGQEGRNHVLVLTYGAWQRRFGGDRDVAGRVLTLNLLPYTIVGVLPPDFEFSIPGYMRTPEFYIPAVLTNDPAQRNNSFLYVLGRLKPGISEQQAQADLKIVDRNLAAAWPQFLTGASTRVVSLREQTVGDVRRVLLVLLGAVSFVLLIACANVANLQLARASAREKEIAIRTALGAGRRRVIRQLLTESLVLAVAGGVLGIGLAWMLLRLCTRFAPAGQLPVTGRVDLTVLLYSIGVSVITGVLFGLVPAMQSSSLRLMETLKQGGRSSAGGGGSLRGALMVAEVALSLVLLAGAGLLIRSFVQLQAVRAGFDPRNVLTLFVHLPGYAYPDLPQRAAFYHRALQEIGSIPGVTAIGAIDDLPLAGDRDSGPLAVEGRPPVTVDRLPSPQQRSVSPGYFQAMQIPLVSGRAFSESDTAQSTPVMVINQSMARHLFPGENPIGRRVTWGLPGPSPAWMTIVGVVGDVRDLSLAARPVDEAYQPYPQATLPYMNLVIRTAGDPAALIVPVSTAFHALNRSLAVNTPQTMQHVLGESIAARRFQMLLLSLFAVIALVLAAVGIYGVVSYTVSRRTGEIGLRMALGAAAFDVARLVVGSCLRLTAIGVAAGLLAAAALTELVSSLLFEVHASDPLTLGGVALLLALVAVLASYIPARRAIRVDPVIALRNE